jgi:hypothetical protein
MLSLAIGRDFSLLAQHGTRIDEGFVFDRYVSRRFVPRGLDAGPAALR